MATQFPEAGDNFQLENTRDLEGQNGISLIHYKSIVPEYATFRHLVAFGKGAGSDSGRFDEPRGIAIHEETGQIYVADSGKHCVLIFSQTGSYLRKFGDFNSWGVLIHGNNAFVTDWADHAISQFSLPDLAMIKRVGKFGAGSEEFNHPRQLTISPNQHLFVADSGNNRVQILDCNLVFKGSLQHQSMTRPFDVKFSISQIFVLSRNDNPCIHTFSLSGEKICSIISNGYGMQVIGALFFCLDSHENIIISDYYAHAVKVFSPEGELLHSLGEIGFQLETFYYPTGVALLKHKNLVSVSENEMFGFQMFS